MFSTKYSRDEDAPDNTPYCISSTYSSHTPIACTVLYQLHIKRRIELLRHVIFVNFLGSFESAADSDRRVAILHIFTPQVDIFTSLKLNNLSLLHSIHNT